MLCVFFTLVSCNLVNLLMLYSAEDWQCRLWRGIIQK